MVHRHRFSQRNHAAFRRAVSGASRLSEHARAGGDVENHSAAALFHFRNGQPRHDKGAFQIGIQRAVPVLFRDFGDAAIGAHAGAVDDDIDAAELLDRF